MKCTPMATSLPKFEDAWFSCKYNREGVLRFSEVIITYRKREYILGEEWHGKKVYVYNHPSGAKEVKGVKPVNPSET